MLTAGNTTFSHEFFHLVCLYFKLKKNHVYLP